MTEGLAQTSQEYYSGTGGQHDSTLGAWRRKYGCSGATLGEATGSRPAARGTSCTTPVSGGRA